MNLKEYYLIYPIEKFFNSLIINENKEANHILFKFNKINILEYNFKSNNLWINSIIYDYFYLKFNINFILTKIIILSFIEDLYKLKFNDENIYYHGNNDIDVLYKHCIFINEM
jgi:hypothetical protein